MERSASNLSSALRKLLDTRVDSFEKLELIMALRRSETGRSTLRDLAHALDLARDEVRGVVLELGAAGLVEYGSDELRLAARGPGDPDVLDELAALYDNDKMTLVKAIADSALGRLHNLAGRAFAEAFVIGKKPGGSDDR